MAAKRFKRGPPLLQTGKSASLFRLDSIANPLKKDTKTSAQSKDKDASTASPTDSNSFNTSDEPEYSAEDGPVRAIYLAYLTLMIETDRVGKARSAASERAVSEISDLLKEYSASRHATLRKTFDFANKYLTELHASYDDLDKTHAAYDRIAKDADTAKRRYEETAKKPNSGLNAIKNAVSRMDADERVELLRQKWKTTDRRLTEARNDYILAIAAANDQQALYATHHFPTWMQKFDTDFHTTARAVFSTHSDLEASIAQTIDAAVKRVRIVVERVDAKIDTDAFLGENAVLTATAAGGGGNTFVFEAATGDRATANGILLIDDDASRLILGQKLSHLMTQIQDVDGHLTKKKVDYEAVKQINASSSTAAGYSQQIVQIGNAANGLDQILDIENSIDLMQCIQARLVAQVKLLEKSNVTPVKPAAIETNTLASPRASIASGISQQQQRPLQQRKYFVALYAYDGNSSSGELSIADGETLSAAVSEDGTDGWITVTSERTGASGIVPFNYIKEVSVAATTVTTSIASVSIGSSIASTSIGGGGTLKRVQQQQQQQEQQVNRDGASTEERVQALYKYDATCEGELTFDVGDVIVVTNKETGSEAWWEGEKVIGKRQRGQFPVNYVKILGTSSGNSGTVVTTSWGRTSGVKKTGEFVVKALYDYEAGDSGELTLRAGEELVIVDSKDADWWVGRHRSGGSEEGMLPAAYVQQVSRF
ncbi:Intersectin 1 (SH3 domain protein) [Physocladia obscura]|uniref:Intersectin 1 (SH3 domain protein) n=1 Tax=Physocladia obscura TaxID=109957 RepID=A0AAD5SU35_9FUNG|nr:Intersectin 1 (SH3 domain protein) [Physocladia obscura]